MTQVRILPPAFMFGPNVFKVNYACDNCGNNWEEEYPKGTKVSERKIATQKALRFKESPFAQHDEASKELYEHEDKWGIIVCPVCGIHPPEVHIARRRPIQER